MEQRENGSECREPNQESVRVTSHAVDYETVERAIVIALEYFESVDGARCSLDEEDFPVIEDDGDESCEGPDWMLDESAFRSR